MTANVIDDRCIDFRTSDPLGACRDNLAPRNDGDVSRPAADINHRGPSGIMSADARAKGRGQTLFDHSDAPDVRILGGAQQRSPLNRRNVRKNTHQRTAAKMRNATAGLAHEMGQHLLCSFEVGDDAVLQWSNHGHATRLAPILLLRLFANSDYFAGQRIDRNKRRLVYYDAASAH